MSTPENDNLDGCSAEAIAIAKRVVGDTKFAKHYMQRAGFQPHRWVIEAVEAGIEAGKGLAGNEHLAVEEAQAEQHAALQTSLIRANMAAVCEAILDGNDNIPDPRCDYPFNSLSVTIDLEKQRTVWDRLELHTERTPDEKSVIFTVTRK